MLKLKNILTIFFTGGILFLFLILGLILPDRAFSDAERRKLAAFPKPTKETLLDGSFMTEFETYTQDQFLLRDTFRSLKSFVSFSIFRKKDNNSIYVAKGYASKLEYPLSRESLENASVRFHSLYNRYFADTDVKLYLSVIPDKNYFLAKANGYPSMDYDEFFQYFKTNFDEFTYIDIVDDLELSDYYKTDTHWRQEEILPVANKLTSVMNVPLTDTYEKNLLDQPFYGVYYGQSALALPAEQLYYMTNDRLSGCTMTNFEDGKTSGVYDFEKGSGKDPYELFLSGSISLLEIENPNATTDKELIVFRDSFGSAIAPYFTECYKKVTLVDIRYLSSVMLGNFIDFTNQDVLFLYSSLVLNHSDTLK